MRIALICTDNESLSLGMRSISAAVKAGGDQSRLLFLETSAKTFSAETLNELRALVDGFEVIGISCLAQGSEKAKQALEYLKPLNKTTIWGGVHASLNPEECARWADYVCIGEGEGLIGEFMERVKNSRTCGDLLNIAYRSDGEVVKNQLRPLIRDLDVLPLPDFSFDDEHHLTKNGIKPVKSLYNVERNGQIVFTSSRGCAFYCTYCCNIKLKNLYYGKDHYVRRMSVSRLIEHAQRLREIFPNGKYFYFIDEDFAARPAGELAELAERFPREVGLPFECLAHPSRITEKNLDLLSRAGLFRVRIGIETGSERTKKEVYNRHVSNKAVNRATELLGRSHHVAPVYFFMYANPYEEREDLLATLELIADLPSGSTIQPFELIFFPGSSLYERAVEDGLIAGPHDSGHEISYYGGLHHDEYPWKKKNLYLNGLLFLAGGRCSAMRIGAIPRFLFRFLVHPGVVDFNEKYTYPTRALIQMRGALYRVRHRAAQALKIVFKDPYAIYNFGFFIRKKLALKAKVSG